MLELTASAAMKQHKLFRHHARDIAAEICLDHCQRKIGASTHAAGGPNLAVVDEDAIFLKRDLRIGRFHLPRERPVRGNTAPIEESRLREMKSARTYCGHTRCRVHRLTDEVDHLR